MDKKTDPLRKNFDGIESIDKYSNCLFYVTAIISLIIFFIEKQYHPKCYSVFEITFIIFVILCFSFTQIIHLCLIPSMEDKRRQDFISHAYGVPLNYEKTNGYYNNHENEAFKKIATQLLENSLFSKTIISKMVICTRFKTGFYMVLFFILLLFRGTSLDIISIIAQTIFSEQIISYWVRLEWLKKRYENIYDNVYRLFLTDQDENKFSAITLEEWVKYETSKSKGGVILSSKIFEKINTPLSEEWEDIKNILKIK